MPYHRRFRERPRGFHGRRRALDAPAGIQARGEFITGRPFDGTTTTGGYVDLLVHRVGMGPVTAVARLERLDYDTTSPFILFARRAMAGARIRIPGGLTAQIATGHQ